MRKRHSTGYRNRDIDTSPANDDWKRAKSTRKEYPTAPECPEELDDGYWEALLSDGGSDG